MLRSFKGLCGTLQATQQLAMLNMVNDQQKYAITTLVNLQKIGMTEDEIGELVKLVGRWKGTGVGQGNGSSSMNRKLDDRFVRSKTHKSGILVIIILLLLEIFSETFYC